VKFNEVQQTHLGLVIVDLAAAGLHLPCSGTGGMYPFKPNHRMCVEQYHIYNSYTPLRLSIM
jgi:hypothetical protein